MKKNQGMNYMLAILLEFWSLPIDCVCVHVYCHVQLFVVPWTIARQAPLSTGFPRQKYWSGLPFPSPGDLLDSGIKLTSLVPPALAGRFFTSWATGEAFNYESTSWETSVLGKPELLVTLPGRTQNDFRWPPFYWESLLSVLLCLFTSLGCQSAF